MHQSVARTLFTADGMRYSIRLRTCDDACMRIAILCLIAMLSSCTGAQQSDPPAADAAAHSPSTTLVCIGDSLTAGYGVAAEEAWPSRLQADLPDRVAVLNAGVSGDTSAGGLRRLDWILRSDPDLALVCLGANDGLRGLPVEETARNLGGLIAGLEQAGVPVVLAGMRLPPNYGPEYTAAFAAIYPRLAERYAVPLLPFLLDGVAGDPALNQGDGVHPNAPGHARIAQTVHAFLREHMPMITAPGAPERATTDD